MTLGGVDWAGRLSESEFLGRLYDLSSLPSTDRRIKDAAGDIRQHRENWTDWDDDWIFYDSRFNLLHGPDDEFLRFLSETVHPVVCSESDRAQSLVVQYNSHLRKDGWEIVETGMISERPVFDFRQVGQRVEVFTEPTGWPKVDRQLQEARVRLQTAATEEQFQAVGLICREVLISVAETVYDEGRHPSVDGVLPSKTDASRMLANFFDAELGGRANEEARTHAKAALKLTLALQHKRTADFRMAALCAEGTASVVNLVAIVSGRRESGTLVTSPA